MEIRIIPAIDLIGGKCVRLSQGDYGRCKVYNDDPLEVARQFEDKGIRLLHLVDLDGAKASRPVNLAVLERIASRTGLEVEFGGGIKSRKSLEEALGAGASRVVCGSVACTSPEDFSSWLQIHGGERLVLGADVRGGEVAVNGWKEGAGITPAELISRFIPAGLQTVEVTDISRDGMLTGPSVSLYEGLMAEFPGLEVVASGGVGTLDDIRALERAGVPSVIVGKALYEGKITLEQLNKE